MPNPVAVNDLQPISGSLQTSLVSYGVETADKNYGQDYNGTTWYSDIPNNGQFYTIISDNYTANYYISRSNAEGAYVEGGLPAVDEYSAPVFWTTVGTSSLDVITTVNGLPDRVGQLPFNSGAEALNWVASSSNYFAVGPDYYAQIDADNLQLYLDANQVISYPTTQSTWYDLSGNTNNGTLENGVTWDSNGWFDFDGSDDDVNLGTTNNLYSGSNVSWEVLFNADSNTGYRALFGNTSTTPPYIALHLSSGAMGLRFEVSVTSGTYVDSFLATATINRWQHFIVTYDGSTFRSYLNGVATGTTPWTQGLGNNTQTFYIGKFWAGVFNGLMNNLKIYQKTLSPSDAAQNYYGGPIVTDNLQLAIDAGNLVSYPKSGTSWFDLSIGGTTGTLTNGPTFDKTYGGSIVFDGVDDSVRFGNSNTNLFPGSATAEAWVRADAIERGTFNDVFRNGSSGLEIQERNDGYWRWYVNVNGSWNFISWTSDGKINVGEWYHIVGTYDEATGDQIIYGNGEVKGIINRGAGSPITYTSIDFIVGNDTSFSRPLKGNIASFRFYNTALTAAEVQQNYNATK
tara:strand:- start:898 stop:2610 length:1713 start_codon:yes stop_codon:yes gene_type:complete